MKALISVIFAFLENKTSRQNLMALVRLLGLMALIMVVFSVLFHVIMEREGQHHSWITGFYWTLTVMSTLGFGDITFESDLGRAFTIVVLVTGVVVLLVLLPFTFIEFFYAPWIRAQKEALAPRELPASMKRHVILTRHGPITTLLVRMLKKQNYPYVVLVPTLAEALELHDKNVPVVVGEYGDPETYKKLRIEQAAMVVTTRSDIINTNVTFSVREVSDRIPIIASILNYLRGGETLLLAEGVSIFTAKTPASLAGSTLMETRIRSRTGCSIIATDFEGQREINPSPDTVLQPGGNLVIIGSLEAEEKFFKTYNT